MTLVSLKHVIENILWYNLSTYDFQLKCNLWLCNVRIVESNIEDCLGIKFVTQTQNRPTEEELSTSKNEMSVATETTKKGEWLNQYGLYVKNTYAANTKS